MMIKKHLTLFLLISTSILMAQGDLRNDLSFFQNRSKDYDKWLSGNELGRFLTLEKVDIYSDKVSLSLVSRYTGERSGDSLRAAWAELRKAYYMTSKQDLHVAMLSKMAFQMNLSLDSTEIIIHSIGSQYYIKIFGEKEGTWRITPRWEEFGDVGLGSGGIRIQVGQLNTVFQNGNISLGEKPAVNLPNIRRAIRSFFRENYEKKGTDWIWKAKIDSTSELYNDFTYTITRISREIIKSHNFFELHQIDITVAEGNDGLEITWTFQAKYGGGLLLPPRDDSNDYHDFETSDYKEYFNKYQASLFKKLENHLKRL